MKYRIEVEIVDRRFFELDAGSVRNALGAAESYDPDDFERDIMDATSLDSSVRVLSIAPVEE